VAYIDATVRTVAGAHSVPHRLIGPKGGKIHAPPHSGGRANSWLMVERKEGKRKLSFFDLLWRARLHLLLSQRFVPRARLLRI